MKKFKLDLRFKHNLDGWVYWPEKFDELMSIKRNVQTIEVFLPPCRDRNVVRMFVELSARLGSRVKHLSLEWVEFENTGDLVDILSFMPMLEYLHILGSFRFVESEQPLVPIQLKNLKTLKIRTFQWFAIQKIFGNKVPSFVCPSQNQPIDPSARKYLRQIVEATKKLEVMEMDSPVLESLFQSELVNLKLKKLFLHLSNSSQENANFNNFLITQAQTVEEIIALGRVMPQYFKTIFSKLKKIKKLYINFHSLPSDKSFYAQLKPIHSLKEIKFVSPSLGVIDVSKGLLGNFPNLETLKTSFVMNSEVLPFMAINNPKLVNLRILRIDYAISPEVKFKFLKYFHVDSEGNFNHVVEFVANNPSIETFSSQSLNLIKKLARMLPAPENTFPTKRIKTTNIKNLVYNGEPIDLLKIYERSNE